MPPRSRNKDTVTDDTPVRDDEQNQAGEDADLGHNADISTASPVGRHPRDTQFPSFGDDGDPKVEVAERTIDIDTASGETTASANHIKDFVLQANEWDGLDDEGKQAVHYRNQRAVRQAMLSQGLRAPLEQDVKFVGEERITTGRGGRSSVNADSVRLRYSIAPTPVAVVADVVVDPETGQVDPKEYELVHMVVSPASVEDRSLGALAQDEWEQGAEARIRDSHAVKAGRATVKS